MNDTQTSPPPNARPEAGEDTGRTKRPRSILQTLLVVSLCFETVIFVPIFFLGAPTKFCVIAAVAAVVSTTIATRLAQKYLTPGNAFAFCFIPWVSCLGVLAFCVLLYSAGVSESVFRGVVTLRCMGLLAIVCISSLVECRGARQ